MRFRPKRRKGERFAEVLPFDIDEASDDEFDPQEHPRLFGPAAPLTPPDSPEDQRRQQQKIKYTRDVLRLNLHHGDILIQQGSGLQKLYEVCFLLGRTYVKHAAVPLGMRIVATARYINTEINSTNGRTATDASAIPTASNELREEIVVESAPIEVVDPRTIEVLPAVSLSTTFLPHPPVPPPIPSISNTPPVMHEVIECLPERSQIPNTASSGRCQPSTQCEYRRTSDDALLLSDRFSGSQSWSGMETTGLFPPSFVRNEQPPIIVASGPGRVENPMFRSSIPILRKPAFDGGLS